MTGSEFRINFPAGVTVPSLLERLLDFHRRNKSFFSGHFELTDSGPATAVAMFDGDQDAAAQFALFGAEADGSAFGFWLYEGRKLEEAPVVYLGSEGTGWTVLADTLEDFLRLLANGVDDLGFDAKNLKFDRTGGNTCKPGRFKWLKTDCGFRRLGPAGPSPREGKAPDLQNG